MLTMRMSMVAPLPFPSPLPLKVLPAPGWQIGSGCLIQARLQKSGRHHIQPMSNGVVAGNHLDSKQRLTARAIAATLRPPLSTLNNDSLPMKNSEYAGIPSSDIILLWGRPGRLSGIEADTSAAIRAAIGQRASFSKCITLHFEAGY